VGIVIDLDSLRSREPDDDVGLGEALDDIGQGFDRIGERLLELETVAREVDKSADWDRQRLRCERRRRRELKRELLAERARSFSFTAEDVLVALRRAYTGHPVSTLGIAGALGVEQPTHSQLVRTGQALSRLAAAGEVVQHRLEDSREGRVTCRWEPVA
jgi:hypothetical protein